MSKTIYFHIGQTKTATTTLQAFFSNNRDWLEERGIHYPECPASHPIRNQHRFLAEVTASLHSPFPAHVPEWDYIREKIDQSTQEKILISEEVFWHLFERRPEEKVGVLEWIKAQFGPYKVKIVCYLRRQDKWIESWFNQLTKTDVNHYSRMSYADFIQAYEDQGMLDYNVALDPWAKVFGEENIVVRSFERSEFVHGDIIQDFMSLFDIHDLSDTIRPKDQQVSLANSACAISNIFNTTPRAKDFKPKFMDIVRQFDGEIEDDRRFTPRVVTQRLLDKHDGSNKDLARRFNGSLPGFFSTSLKDYDRGEYPGLDSSELARFMVHIFQDQQLQIRQLRKKVVAMENALQSKQG